MDKKRRKEIAMAIDKENERRERIYGFPVGVANLAEMAERIGVTCEELEEYYQLMIFDALRLLAGK